jgi:Epoxide hydrolase N terminus
MSVTTEKPAEAAAAIRPFTFETPQADLDDLRARIAATRWPERETVDDPSQGVQLATIQALARYWETEYDWRACEAKLKALPKFITEIDGLDIHFVHVRSKHEDALPLIVLHGWPGSIIEQMKIIGPLTDPTASSSGRRTRPQSLSPWSSAWPLPLSRQLLPQRRYHPQKARPARERAQRLSPLDRADSRTSLAGGEP